MSETPIEEETTNDVPVNETAVWAADGKFRTPSERARELAWIASGGQTGVVGPYSLAVTPTPTPSNRVVVNPGAFVAQATPGGSLGYPSAQMQSYMRAIDQPIEVEIGPTDSSGRRIDVVGIVVDDPNYEGTSDSVDWGAHEFFRVHVARNVGPGAARPEGFPNIRRPFVPLARITVPASTATIDESMITDLRFPAVRREWTAPALITPAQTTFTRDSSSEAWVDLEQIGGVEVPQWATHVKLDGEILGVSTRSDWIRGAVRARFNAGGASLWTDEILWRSPSGTDARFEIPVAGSLDLRPDHRGARAAFRFQVQVISGPGTLRIASEVAHYRLRLTFEEAPSIQLTGN